MRMAYIVTSAISCDNLINFSDCDFTLESENSPTEQNELQNTRENVIERQPSENEPDDIPLFTSTPFTTPYEDTVENTSLNRNEQDNETTLFEDFELDRTGIRYNTANHSR